MHVTQIEKIEEGRYNVTSLLCIECHTTETIEVSSKWVFDLHQGGSGSELLPSPEYSMGLRERFITGLCDKDWQKVMLGVEA